MQETDLLRKVSPIVREQLHTNAEAIARKFQHGQLLCDNCHASIDNDYFLVLLEVVFQSGAASEIGRVKTFHRRECCADVYTSRIDLDPAIRYELLLPENFAKELRTK
ncbi:MAG: hypothetical protein AB1489_09935 [Acidobacteriota bacterium]